MKDNYFKKDTLSLESDVLRAINNVVYDSFLSMSATRSSDRTDVLHLFMKNIIESGIKPKDLVKSPFVIKTDTDKSVTQLPDAYGKKISCDVVVANENKKNITDVLMIKAPISSINKNIQNSYNNALGESIRILGNPLNELVQVCFINFSPREAPVFDRNGQMKTTENVRHIKPIDLSGFGILEKNVNMINVYYDLDESLLCEKIKNKTDIKNQLDFLNSQGKSFVKNLDLTDFVKLIMKLRLKFEN